MVSEPSAAEVCEALLRTGNPNEMDSTRSLLFFLMDDAYRLYSAIRFLNEQFGNSLRPPGPAIEVLLRRLIEQAIVIGYLARKPDTARTAEWFMSNHAQYHRTWGKKVEPLSLPGISQLPNTTDMANHVNPDLLVVYQMLSHRSHPNQAAPYAMIEFDEISAKRGVPADFYRKQLGDFAEFAEFALAEMCRDFALACKQPGTP